MLADEGRPTFLDTVTDFLIKLGLKLHMHLSSGISIFSLITILSDLSKLLTEPTKIGHIIK
jgi:hypothetical protein